MPAVVNLGDTPSVRALAVMVALAAGIRLVFWLLAPVWPYLLAVLVAFVVLRMAAWWRGRW